MNKESIDKITGDEEIKALEELSDDLVERSKELTNETIEYDEKTLEAMKEGNITEEQVAKYNEIMNYYSEQMRDLGITGKHSKGTVKKVTPKKKFKKQKRTVKNSKKKNRGRK